MDHRASAYSKCPAQPGIEWPQNPPPALRQWHSHAERNKAQSPTLSGAQRGGKVRERAVSFRCFFVPFVSRKSGRRSSAAQKTHKDTNCCGCSTSSIICTVVQIVGSRCAPPVFCSAERIEMARDFTDSQWWLHSYFHNNQLYIKRNTVQRRDFPFTGASGHRKKHLRGTEKSKVYSGSCSILKFERMPSASRQYVNVWIAMHKCNKEVILANIRDVDTYMPNIATPSISGQKRPLPF